MPPLLPSPSSLCAPSSLRSLRALPLHPVAPLCPSQVSLLTAPPILTRPCPSVAHTMQQVNMTHEIHESGTQKIRTHLTISPLSHILSLFGIKHQHLRATWRGQRSQARLCIVLSYLKQYRNVLIASLCNHLSGMSHSNWRLTN